MNNDDLRNFILAVIQGNHDNVTYSLEAMGFLLYHDVDDRIEEAVRKQVAAIKDELIEQFSHRVNVMRGEYMFKICVLEERIDALYGSPFKTSDFLDDKGYMK